MRQLWYRVKKSEHHSHGAALRWRVVQALAIPHEASLRGRLKAGDEAQGSRLAVSRRIVGGGELPLGNVK